MGQTSDLIKAKLLDTNQDHEGREQYDRPKKIVSPLQRLLMDVPLETFLAFLHQSHIRFVLAREKKGYYVARIYGEGMLEYRAISGESARAAFADALAKFLVGEKHDYHDYGWPRAVGNGDA